MVPITVLKNITEYNVTVPVEKEKPPFSYFVDLARQEKKDELREIITSSIDKIDESTTAMIVWNIIVKPSKSQIPYFEITTKSKEPLSYNYLTIFQYYN